MKLIHSSLYSESKNFNNMFYFILYSIKSCQRKILSKLKIIKLISQEICTRMYSDEYKKKVVL